MLRDNPVHTDKETERPPDGDASSATANLKPTNHAVGPPNDGDRTAQ